MDHRALLDRILRAVDDKAYLPLADAVDPDQRDAMALIQAELASPGFDVERTRALARRLHAEGRIDRVMLYSALHVIAASPRVRDYEDAARMVAEQEMAAIRVGGPRLEYNLASVDRHRGVIAFLMGQNEIALDYFSRAFERHRSPGNVANVLATLLRLGEEGDARDVLRQVRALLPPGEVAALDGMIAKDPDLALLR